MIDSEEKQVVVKDYGKRRKRSDAVLRTSILGVYVDTRFGDAIKDRQVAFGCAAEAFRKELMSAMVVRPIDDGDEVTTRYEQVRPFIIKLLLYLGKIPTDSTFTVAARLIEACVLRPSANISDLIKDLAQSVGSSFAAVKRIAERSIDCYDDTVLEKIYYLTGTEPFNAIDAICDLAVYIRMKMFGNGAHA